MSLAVTWELSPRWPFETIDPISAPKRGTSDVDDTSIAEEREVSEPLRPVGIDGFFLVFFGRGRQFNDVCAQSAYLDLETGDILQVFENDLDGERSYGVAPSENQALSRRVEAMPERYLEIPGLDRENHHAILSAFLDSEWTEDEKTRVAARNAFKDSIADWIGLLGCDALAVRAYSNFRHTKVEQQAREFLGQHGIEPTWR